MLCCFDLFVCLTLLASFFLPSHLSFKNMYLYMSCTNVYIRMYRNFAGSPHLDRSLGVGVGALAVAQVVAPLSLIRVSIDVGVHPIPIASIICPLPCTHRHGVHSAFTSVVVGVFLQGSFLYLALCQPSFTSH